jgi:hypothetical protein
MEQWRLYRRQKELSSPRKRKEGSKTIFLICGISFYRIKWSPDPDR